MELDNIVRIAEILGGAIGGGIITNILSTRSRLRKEKADAAKAETEVEADKIANIKKMMDDVYRPIIEDLKAEVADLNRKVSELNAQAEEQQAEMREIKKKNDMLEAENKALREAVKNISPESAPNIRSLQATYQERNKNGQFTKAKGNEDKA